MIDLDIRLPVARTAPDLEALLRAVMEARDFELARPGIRDDMLLVASFIVTFVASEMTVEESPDHEIHSLGQLVDLYAKKYGKPVLTRRLTALVRSGAWADWRTRYRVKSCASPAKGAAS